MPGTILKGTIVSQIGNDVVVEVGLKSEGIVDAGEFDHPEDIVAGKEIDVLLEDTDRDTEDFDALSIFIKQCLSTPLQSDESLRG